MGVCQFNPCHQMDLDREIDCRLCFCPFYECCSKLSDRRRTRDNLAGYWLHTKGKKPVFACELCNFNHYKEVADYYLTHQNEDLGGVFEECVKIYDKILTKKGTVFAIVVKTQYGPIRTHRSYSSMGLAKLSQKKMSRFETYIEELPDPSW